MRHVHSNASGKKLTEMMVGNDQNKTKSKESKTSSTGNIKRSRSNSNSRSGRTSPGLNVKRFTIPKKQKELLNEVELESSEYLREVLPIIQQGYRDSSSKNKFNYEKVQLIHNPALKKEFIEKKREMKDAGRNDKELMESYAFLFVETEEKAKQLSKESLHAVAKGKLKQHCLGSPSMGVHVCRYSDVLHRNGMPKEGVLLLFKVLKGKVKAVPLVYGAKEILEPTPNYDCHVAKNSGEELPSSASHRLFDSSELFIYDFDEDEVEFRKRPRNICPYAVVHFTYSDSGVASSATSSNNFNRTPVASSNETTPTRNISIPDTVGIAVVAPCFPREEVATQRPVSDADRTFVEKYNDYSERSYRVWSGQLHNKNGNSCRVSLVSFGLSFLPCKMPEALHALKAVRIRELRLPTKVFTGTVPVLSRVKEAQANGKYYWYAELHSLSLDDAVYSRFLNYLTEKDLVLKKELDERVLLYILPTGKTTHNLGLTTSSHPKIMHCLVESYVPMVSHLTDITVKQPRHQVKQNLESAPIHDIDKDHLKRLRFQSSLAKLFYEQNRELKDSGVKGDAEEVPVPVTVPRQSSVEQEEPVMEAVGEMSPASPVEHVAENLNTSVPRNQHLEHQQSNQGTAPHSNPEALTVDKQHLEDPTDRHDWNNYSNDWRSEHPSGTQSWDRSLSQSIQQKEQSRHWLEMKQSHANQDPCLNLQKPSQSGGEASNHHIIQQSPESPPQSSYPAEHHRLGHQPYEHQTGRTEHRSGHQPYERQSSKEWAPPKASPRGSESRSHQHHYDRYPSKPSENTQYKRQSSSDWTDQQPSAKRQQDRRPPEAPKGDLTPQIKEVASKVHDMLTGGIDLGLRGAAGDANLQRLQEETDDEKIARMRATLQALVEERERLAKNNTDKNSANPPTSVPPKGNEVLSSPSSNTDSNSEPKHPPDRPKESIEEKPNKSIVVEKPKEIAMAAGNATKADVKTVGKEVEKIREKAMDKVMNDCEKDAVKRGKEEEKMVEETDGVKRKLEELEEPVKKKMRVDVLKPEADEEKHAVPKDHPTVPKSVAQKNIVKDNSKTISKPLRDLQSKGTSNQEPKITKEPGVKNQKQKLQITKTERDQKKLRPVEKKPKSDVEEKNRVSKKSESRDKSSKVPKEITSASQMREYLDKKRAKGHISSASEMRMFLENPDKVSSKPRRIKSASEMRQFLNQPFTRNKSSKMSGSEGQKGRPTAVASSNTHQYCELEGKSRNDLLKNHDGDLASTHLQNFLSSHHQIILSPSQGVRVTVKREMAGARLSPPPPLGSPRGGKNEENDCTSSITAVCHGSHRSLNGTHPDTSTKEGLAYQIRQVIHHSQPVKKTEPRKVKEIQKASDQRRQSSPRNSAESKEQGRVESPANIPDGACFLGDLDNEEEGKKKGSRKSTSKKQPRNMKPISQVKKSSLSKVEAPSHVESKDTPLQVPRKTVKLKIKKIKKSYTTSILSTEEAVKKEKVTTKAGQVLDSTRDPSQKNKSKDNARTGKTSGPYVSVKCLPKTQSVQQSTTAVDKILDQDSAVTKVDGPGISEGAMSATSACHAVISMADKEEKVHHDSTKGVLLPVDVTAAVRDMVKCLSADEIRQLIGVYDEIFSRRHDTNESQPIPSDNKIDPDAMQLSTLDSQSCGDARQSGLQREDQDNEGKEEKVLTSPEESVLKTSSDVKEDNAPAVAVHFQETKKTECCVGNIKQPGKDDLPERGVPFLQKMGEEHPVDDIKQLGEDHPPKQGIHFLRNVEADYPVDDTKSLGEDHPQENGIPFMDMEEKGKSADAIKPTEDEDTLPYPLEPDQGEASEVDQVEDDKKVPLLNEACIDLYDSERWSELDEDVQADASKEHTLHGSAGQSGNVQPVNDGTTSLKMAEKPVKDDVGETAVSLESYKSQVTPSYTKSRDSSLEHSDLLSILSREFENNPPINKQTDVEHGEGSKRVSVFERLSTVQPKTRNVVVDDKDNGDNSGMSFESVRYPEESGVKVKRTDSQQPTINLPAFPEASESLLSNSESKSTEHEEKSTKVSVFDRLDTKQPDQEPQKKRVSVFDRLYVPKPDKPEPLKTEPNTFERVSAFDRLSSRKVTKTSAQEKEKNKEDTSSRGPSSKVKTEKMVKIVLSSKVNKVDSGKATAAISSKVSTIKPKKADVVVQTERQTSDKNMPKNVLKSKKRELPKEDVPANKKYKLALKDQVDRKDNHIDRQKENFTSNKDSKLGRKDPVNRVEKYREPSRDNIASSNKHKQVTKSHGKKEKDKDVQRERHTSSKKHMPVTKDHVRREEKYVDKRSDKRSDKRHVSRKREDKKDNEYKRHDSRGRDSDHSSVSTKEDSDSIRQNILKRAQNQASDFSKYVVSGQYLKIEGKKPLSPRYDPDPLEAITNDSTNRAGLDKGFGVTNDRTMVHNHPQEEQSKYDSTCMSIQNKEETQPFSVPESYPVEDQISRETNYSQVSEQQIHTISVIGGSTSNSMRPFHEMNVSNVTITNDLSDDLPLNKISVIGNREDNEYPSGNMQTQLFDESYDIVSHECPTTLSPETKRAFEQVLKASIGSPTKQDYCPESPTDSIRSIQSCHQDQPLITNDVRPLASGYKESGSTFTESTYEKDAPSQDSAKSTKMKTSLKAPSSRQVHYGNRFHPYDKRVKTFQGHCLSLREPETAELINNFCKEEYRMRYMRAAARVSALSQKEAFFDQARMSPSRFGSLNEMSHDERVIHRADEEEMTHSREGAGDAVAGQRGEQLQILDRQIEALTASGSDIQDYFILDANVYPIKNGDDSALSGVPPKMRARRGRGRPPPARHRGPPHPYQIRAQYPGHPSGSRGYPHDSWNGPGHRVWNGPSQRSLDRWDRSSRYPPPNKFRYRKGH